MLVIKEHIRSGSFKQYYLLYGSESYLKKLYRDKLKAAILGDGDEMNYSYYEGKGLDIKSLSEVAQTLPFFSDRRLILVENCGLFKNQSDLVDHLKDIPESTIIVFIEDEVDKRNRLYKFFKDKGTVSEMNGMDQKNLKLFVASLLEQEGKKITVSTVDYLLDKCGFDMLNLKNEVDKLIGYTGDRDVITAEDIDAVVTTQITGKIFQMIDAIGSKQQDNAMSMYYDLIQLREKPMSILYLIIRHFNILLQVKELNERGHQSSAISEMVGIPPFASGKYISQSRNFTKSRLKYALEYGTEIEEGVKTGKMLEHIGVELLIINFSTKNAG